MIKNKELSVYVNQTITQIDKLYKQGAKAISLLKNKTLRGKENVAVPIVSDKYLKYKPLAEFSWRDCKKYNKSKQNNNRTEALYQQLKKVVHVFNTFNKTNYVIGYGTLLGIRRENKMNVNEVDNDIIVDRNFNPDTYKEALFKEGLIIFGTSGINRICEYSPVRSAAIKAPWIAGNYCTYTDIYKQLPYVWVDPEKPDTALRTKVNIVQRKFRDIYVNVPEDKLIIEWFGKRYKNWRVPSITGWKKNVKDAFQ